MKDPRTPDEMLTAIEGHLKIVTHILEQAQELENAIIDVFGPDGCACIRDLPGDNYTCTSHEKLIHFAREAYKQRKGQST